MNRAEDPESFKANVDDIFPHLPGLKNYNSAIFREMNTIDTTKSGLKLWAITEALINVEILCDSEVTGYDFEDKTNLVKAVRLGKNKKIYCDQVVIANGP